MWHQLLNLGYWAPCAAEALRSQWICSPVADTSRLQTQSKCRCIAGRVDVGLSGTAMTGPRSRATAKTRDNEYARLDRLQVAHNSVFVRSEAKHKIAVLLLRRCP